MRQTYKWIYVLQSFQLPRAFLPSFLPSSFIQFPIGALNERERARHRTMHVPLLFAPFGDDDFGERPDDALATPEEEADEGETKLPLLLPTLCTDSGVGQPSGEEDGSGTNVGPDSWVTTAEADGEFWFPQ